MPLVWRVEWRGGFRPQSSAGGIAVSFGAKEEAGGGKGGGGLRIRNLQGGAMRGKAGQGGARLGKVGQGGARRGKAGSQNGSQNGSSSFTNHRTRLEIWMTDG